MTRPENEGGDDLDGCGTDDFHHSAIVALTWSKRWLFQRLLRQTRRNLFPREIRFPLSGQALSWRKVLRGTPTFGVPAEAFVCFIENHDQIANTGPGEPAALSKFPGRYRAITLFFCSDRGHHCCFKVKNSGVQSLSYFLRMSAKQALPRCDRKGSRRIAGAIFIAYREETLRRLPAPDDPQTFSRCKLDFSEREKNRKLYDLHIDLLKLRREDSRFRLQSSGGIDGAVLGPATFVLRYFSEKKDDRLLIVNFRERHILNPAGEPLLAPMSGFRWETLWTSDAKRYGGADSMALATEEQWLLPAESTVALRPVP
jgi:maltooligosyltrehalose trehalohydrolase